MKIAIIGGKLQGVEACYLAKKANWQVLLIDKNQDIPALGLCDEFCRWDVTKEKDQFFDLLKQVDLILPAMENIEALKSLTCYRDKLGVPLAFDPHAYQVSCSKIDSNQVFLATGTPMPRLWPECQLPLVVKPSDSSGSEGVFKVKTEEDLKKLKEKPEIFSHWVVQEFVTGPSYSIEVIGYQEKYQVYQVTELEMDEHYDCKRVLAPAVLSDDLKKTFEHIGLNLARHLKLQGIMDVEVILHQGELKVLEIDARLPSQTPTVVYKSTGLNMVEVLGNSFIKNQLQERETKKPLGAVYEHIQVSEKDIKVCGEYIMGGAGPLKLIPDFFGADEAITNYSPGKKEWVATLINTGSTREEAWLKRCLLIDRIVDKFKINYIDLSPEDEI
ncbi:MAG: 3-methylornithine--L-lysine ligase PylC [Dehalobacterium sp.]